MIVVQYLLIISQISRHYVLSKWQISTLRFNLLIKRKKEINSSPRIWIHNRRVYSQKVPLRHDGLNIWFF